MSVVKCLALSAASSKSSFSNRPCRSDRQAANCCPRQWLGSREFCPPLVFRLRGGDDFASQLLPLYSVIAVLYCRHLGGSDVASSLLSSDLIQLESFCLFAPPCEGLVACLLL